MCVSPLHYSIIRLPYTRNGIQIAPFGYNIRLSAKLQEIELEVYWNNDDYLMASGISVLPSDHLWKITIYSTSILKKIFCVHSQFWLNIDIMEG